MNLILLLIFAFTVKGDSDESKYVDLLPEEEKEEFIQKVARRIIENVETKKVSNQSSVEIPDDELKEHEALVKQIMKEESGNIRRHRMEKDKLDSEGDVSVKSIENLKEVQRAEHIDLTMRTDRKKRRDGGELSEIPVEVVTENVIIKTKNFGSEVKTQMSDEKANNHDYVQSSKEDIQVRHIERPVTENTETTTHHFDQEHSNVTETVQNIKTDISKEDTIVKTIKRRAIENDTTTGITDTGVTEENNVNETESVTASKEHNPTIMEDFDVKSSGEETTEYETTETNTTHTNTSETTTTAATAIQETTANVTSEVKGNESMDSITISMENHRFTQAIYDSELESDRDCSNETVNDNALALSNTSVVEDTTRIKRYLRSNDYDIVTDAAEIDNSEKSIDTIETGIETVTGENIDDIVQFSTTEEGHTDKIKDVTVTVSDSSEKDTKTLENTLPSLISKDGNEKDKGTKLSGTDDSSSDTTVPSNTDKTVSNDVTTTTVSDIIIVKDISDTPRVVTVPTNTVPTPVPYVQNDQANEGLKSFIISSYLVPRTRFSVVSDAITDEALTNETNKDINQTKNNMITTIIPSLTTINNKFKGILATTESIITTINTQKPALTTTDRVENQTKRAKIDTENKKPATAKNNTKPPAKLKHEKPIQVADKVVDMLKDSLLLVNDDKKKEVDVFKDLQKEFYRQFHNKKKEYQVYEIPADKPPFVRDHETITEQPYYVPVYNYSPNKAYFNANNRLGPNADDGENINLMETEFDTQEDDAKEPAYNAPKTYQYFGSFKDSPTYYNEYLEDNQRKKFGIQGTYSKLNDITIPQPIKWPILMRKPTYKETNYNPDDYVDVDYANRKDINVAGDRSGKIFPDSDDETHPFNRMKNGTLKDQLSAIRNMLYEKGLFNYPHYEPTEADIETTTEPEMENATDSRYYRNGDKSSAIALDYYFGRMKPEASSERSYYKNVGYFKKYNKTKNLYINNEFLDNNLIKYINMIKYDRDTYINGDTATPHTGFIDEITPNSILNSKINEVPSKIKIISMREEADLYNTLEASQEFNVMLRKEDDNINVFINVLKDMVHLDNNALKQYDWLGTAVDLQSALDKLLGLIEGVQSIEDIHPSDLELLKYVVFLHKLSYEIVESRVIADKLRKMLFLPQYKRNKKSILTENDLLNEVWMFLRRKRTKKQLDNILENSNEFLVDLQDALYDLHDAIKNIAKISTFKKQNWFQNIKDLYVIDDRSYLSLLLHISANRLFGLIEDSARSNLEDDFKSYVRRNRKDTMKTVEEMLFVLRILDHIKTYE